MIADRTLSLIQRLPRSFATQALAFIEDAQARQAAADQRRKLEFLCAVEVQESGWQEWQDTIAEFNAR